jgi:hypothetical protein
MAKLQHDNYELTKLQLDLSPFAHECDAVLRTVQHTGMTFGKSNTTVTKDRTDNNTTIIQDYGRIHASFAVDPKATSIADYANKQINGQNKGAKQTGSLMLFDSEGNETSRWSIERWHLEQYVISGFNTKSSANMVQSITIDMEKFTRA